MANLGLPAISSSLPSDVRLFLARVRDFIQGAVDYPTKAELAAAGVITIDNYSRVIGGSGGEIDASPPPAPTGVRATGAMTNIVLEWDAPLYANFAYAEIYRAGLDDLGSAVHIGVSIGTMYVDAVAPDSDAYYWVRFWSKADLPGAWNATSGTHGSTARNPAYLLSTLAGSISNSQLASDLAAKVNSIPGYDARIAGVENAYGGLAGQVSALAGNLSIVEESNRAGEAVVRSLLVLDTTRDASRKNQNSIALVRNDVTETAADLAAETAVRTSELAQVTTDIATLSGALINETTARADADTAESAARLILTARVTTAEGNISTNAADIANETTARADAIAAEASARTTLAARVTTAEGNIATNAAAITTEATTRADAITAEAAARTTLAARVTTAEGNIAANASAITTEATTRADAITTEAAARTALASRVTTAEGNIAANASAITTEATTRADAIATEAAARTALASRVTTAEGDIAANASAITTESNTRATAITTEANARIALDSRVTTAEGNITTNAAAITSEASTRATAITTVSNQINTVSARLDAGGDTATAIATAQTTANTGVANAASAQSTANTALANAATAQTTANTAVSNAASAQSAANTANSLLADIASDAKLTPVEKSAVRAEWDVIAAEKSGIDTQATTFAATAEKATYDAAFQALATYLNAGVTWSSGVPSWIADANLATATDIAGASFRSQFKSYYDARTALLNKCADVARANAATAQATANAAQSAASAAAADAASALTAANNAQISANTANTTLADIASDALLTPDEKPRVIQDRDVILAEQSGIDAQATSYGITTEKTAYDTAVTALTTYLATLTSPVLWTNLTGNTTIVGTVFRSKFADVYTARQALLNAIAAKAKTLADGAQTTANAAVSSITTLQTTVSGHTSSIQTQQTSLNGISALYMVKLDVNGVASGYALASDLAVNGTVTSKAIWSVDQFAIIAPGRTAGALSSVPFAVITTPQTINGVAFDPGVYIDGASINTQTVGNQQIANLAVDDAKVATVSADKIRSGTISAGNEITVGSTLLLSGSGFIDSYGPGPVGQRSYTRMDAGDVVTYRYVPALSAAVPYKSLTRVETGTAANGALVVIPGYFTSPPRVIVSPAVIQTYAAAYAAQDQTFDCSAGVVSETAPGSMVWQFTPVARLDLAAGTSGSAPNSYWPAASYDSTDTWYTDTLTTPANTAVVRPSVAVSSVLGSSTYKTYNLRQVAVYGEYWNGSAWTGSTLLGTIAVGPTQSWTSTSALSDFTFPGSATWSWRLKFVASNAGGTFVGDASAFDTTTSSTLSSTAGTQFGASNSVSSVSMPLPAYSPPANYTVYQIAYTYAFQWGLQTVNPGDTASISGPGFAASVSYPTDNFTYLSTPYTVTGAIVPRTSYSAALTLTLADNGGTSTYAEAWINSASAVVYSAKPKAVQNRALVTGIVQTLSSAQVLATGTINWMAVSE